MFNQNHLILKGVLSSFMREHFGFMKGLDWFEASSVSQPLIMAAPPGSQVLLRESQGALCKPIYLLLNTLIPFTIFNLSFAMFKHLLLNILSPNLPCAYGELQFLIQRLILKILTHLNGYIWKMLLNVKSNCLNLFIIIESK